MKLLQKSMLAGTLLGAILTASPAHAEMLTREAQGLKLHAAKGALLVDIRDREPYEAGHIESAINIPLPEIVARVARFGSNKNRFIVVYGEKDLNLGATIALLVKYGYSNAFNAGSYEGMIAEQNPVPGPDLTVAKPVSNRPLPLKPLKDRPTR